MKTLLTILLFHSSCLVQAEEIKNARTVNVSATLQTARDDAKRKKTETTTHHLEITLRRSHSDSKKFKVVAIIYAKELPGKNISQHRSTQTVNLTSGKAVTLTSSPEKFTETREHKVRVKKKNNRNNRSNNRNNRNRNQVRFKTIPASGQKQSGWAVRVYDKNGQLVGETASASHLKLDR